MREDKQMICNLLLKALQATSEYSDLVGLEYVEPEQPNRYESYVDATYTNGYIIRVNTSMDSGSAMIYDILRQTK